MQITHSTNIGVGGVWCLPLLPSTCPFCPSSVCQFMSMWSLRHDSSSSSLVYEYHRPRAPPSPHFPPIPLILTTLSLLLSPLPVSLQSHLILLTLIVSCSMTNTAGGYFRLLDFFFFKTHCRSCDQLFLLRPALSPDVLLEVRF